MDNPEKVLNSREREKKDQLVIASKVARSGLVGQALTGEERYTGRGEDGGKKTMERTKNNLSRCTLTDLGGFSSLRTSC